MRTNGIQKNGTLMNLVKSGLVDILREGDGGTNWGSSEGVTGRKARGPQAEEIDGKGQPFFFFFSFSIQNLKGISFKILCCHDDIWFPLNVSFLRP